MVKKYQKNPKNLHEICWMNRTDKLPCWQIALQRTNFKSVLSNSTEFRTKIEDSCFFPERLGVNKLACTLWVFTCSISVSTWKKLKWTVWDPREASLCQMKIGNYFKEHFVWFSLDFCSKIWTKISLVEEIRLEFF